jgi:hyperosmotically inducible protein
VKTQLLADDDVEGSDINVTTTGGVVMLSGVVPTQSVRKEAAEIASNVDGVKKVDTTQLMVK